MRITHRLSVCRKLRRRRVFEAVVNVSTDLLRKSQAMASAAAAVVMVAKVTVVARLQPLNRNSL